ncbi:MAG: hypothetical protein KA799_02190 [Bacteroidales bacterium]|nr:hypothetical protein [Bacteroidales bacterium]
MVNVVYKKKGLKINAVWFCDDVDKTIKASRADFVFLHGVYANSYKKAITSKQYSLTTDLTVPQEEIFKGFSKNYRYEINRAKKESVECIAYNSDDFKNNHHLLSMFKKEYDDFVKLKGIENTYNELAMEQYIERGSVILTKAFKDDVNYAQHVYVSDKKIARLLYSVSNFRTEGLDSNLIGRANKYLHWYDIQYLCDCKINVLDWGGISSIDGSNGVDKFKKEFGGRECSYYNVILGKSIIGKIVISLMKLKRG